MREELEAVDLLDLLSPDGLVAERATGGKRQLGVPEVEPLLGRRDRHRRERLHRDRRQRERAQPPGRPPGFPHTPLPVRYPRPFPLLRRPSAPSPTRVGGGGSRRPRTRSRTRSGYGRIRILTTSARPIRTSASGPSPSPP